MFGFFKRKLVTEMDFDVLKGGEYRDVRFSQAAAITQFLEWTHDESRMSYRSLAVLINKTSKTFHDLYGSLAFHQKAAIAEAVARDVLRDLRKLGLIKVNKDMSTARITKKGEQIRQFYVLKRGLRGTLYDRMDRFAAA